MVDEVRFLHSGAQWCWELDLKKYERMSCNNVRIYKSSRAERRSLSVCRRADAGGENGFQECTHKSCCTVVRASRRCKSRGRAFSLTSATNATLQSPSCERGRRRRRRRRPISSAARSPPPSPSISSLQSNFTRPTPAFRRSQKSFVGTTCGWRFLKSLRRRRPGGAATERDKET